jgi:hypothetical protein
VTKVALTIEDACRLPGDVTKAGDSRAAAFVEKYGDLAVELDALPVEELRARIRAGVEGHMDLDALERSHDLEREHRERLAELADSLAGDWRA